MILALLTSIGLFSADCSCDPCYCEGWFPKNPIFTSFVADPRRVGISVGWRFEDDIFEKNTGPVAFGDNLVFYQWCSPLGYPGVAQVGIEGNVYAIFEQTDFSAPLVNADYYVAIPISYKHGPFEARLRLYHISSHIGDEFLLNHPTFVRLNPSAEYVDVFASYRGIKGLRLYGGLGWIARSDESFRCKKFYLEQGFEWYPKCMHFSLVGGVTARPFVATHFRNIHDNGYKFDGTMAIGYQWDRDYECDQGKKVRLFLELHKGQSFEGQFSRQRTDYFSVQLAYGY